ncbi:MAG TPA: fibronectin type III domain-containing protein, partial [Clostridia bacterium]
MKKLSKTLVVLCITFAIFGLFNVNFNESRICWGNDVEAATPTYSTYQTYQPGSQVNWENHVFNFTLPANAVVTNVSVSYWNIRSLMGPYGNIETKYNNNNDINTTAYFPGASKIVSINTDYNTGSSGIYYVSVDSGNYMRFVENATCTVTYKINHNPSVAISSPVQNQLVPGQFNLLYSFNDQDAGDRIRVYCSVDNVVKNELSIDATSTGSSQQISKMVDVSTLGAGSHTMTVWAVDNYNLEGRATVAFIKNYTPFIKIDTPTPNSCFSEIQGNNKIIVSGTFIDPDVGDYDTIYYSVDNNTAVKLLDGMTANSSYQYFSAAIDPSSITEGSHKLSFFVQDSRGGRSAQDIYIYIDRTVPSISSYTATALSGSISMTMNVSDTVGLGTSPYKFTVGSNTTGWINSNAYKQTSLLPNTTYNVELRTRDIAGHELFINKQICSLSETPSVFIDNISSSSAEINLTDNNPENTQYQIIVGSQYLSESGYLSSNPVWIKIPKKRIMLYNLNTGTSYSVQAKTQNAEGIQSSYSTVQTFKTLNSNVISLDKPQVTATKSDTSITLTWPDVNNSYGYDISKDNVQEYSISYPYTINGLKPGSIHKYRARAKNQNGPGPWSDELTVLTNGSIGSLTPQNVTAEVSDTSVKVIWDPLSSATSYEVILTAPDSTTKDYTTNDNFYLFTGINPNTQYQYKVRAFSNQTAGDWSSLTSVATLPSGIIPPSNFNATPSDSSIKLSWDKVAVATGYQIDIDGTIIDVSDNSYVQSSVQKDRIYSYRVRTKSNNLMSIWSNIYTCDVSDISFQRNCQSGEVFKFALTASNVRTFENRKI